MRVCPCRTDIPPRKIIRDSKNDLEKLIFKQLFKYFQYCTRTQLKLTPDAQACLQRDVKTWQSLEFFEVSRPGHPYAEAHIRKHTIPGHKPQPGGQDDRAGDCAAGPAGAAATDG